MKKLKFYILIIMISLTINVFSVWSFTEKLKNKNTNAEQAESQNTNVNITLSKEEYNISSYTKIVNYMAAEKEKNGAPLLSSLYGGAYINENQELTVYIKGGEDRAKEKIKEITGNSSIIYLDANYSFDELYKVYALLSDKTAEFELMGVSISESKNIVEVSSKSSAEICKKKLAPFINLSMVEIFEHCSEGKDL